MTRGTLHALFFMSGAAGLVWQVCWVRAFTGLFSQTVVSASLVAGVFVLGLGVGAYLIGPWADRSDARRCVQAYGACEIAIAGWGALGVVALAWLGPATAGLGGYVADAGGWLHPSWLSLAIRISMAVVWVGGPAALMGATFTLLTKHLVAEDVPRAGLRVGLLYGINTLGAAMGAWATDAWLVPTVGLAGTQYVAVAINAGAGLISLAVASRVAERTEPDPAPEELPWDADPDGGEGGPTWPIGLAVFFGGVSALGFEILWLRFLGSALGAYRAVFAMLLSVHLVGLWVGATFGGALSRRRHHARALLGACQVAAGCLALVSLLTWDADALARAQLALRTQLAGASPSGGYNAVLWMELTHIVGLVLPASIAMGMALPLANAVVQAQGSVGRRAGGLYLAATTGNLVGSLGLVFLLLPWLGIQGSAIVLLGFAVAGASFVVRRRVHFGAPLLGVLCVLWAATLPADRMLLSAFPAGLLEADGVVATHEGVEHTLIITGSPGRTRLWTSGHPMSSTTPHASRYMRLMAHLPLLQLEAPRRALVIGFGVGNTVHASSLHPLTELEVADLDASILEHARYFAHANHDVLSDPRVRSVIDDGRHWLRQQPNEHYDFITMEPPPIATAGIGTLYSVELYRLARSRLREGGGLSQWLPAYQIPEPAVRSLVAAFLAVFPEATLHVGDGRELILVGFRGPTPPLDLATVRRRMGERPMVTSDLAAHGVEGVDDFALSFAADARRLRAVTARATPLTDDLPTLEYSQVSHIMETRLPEGLMAPMGIGGWCLACEGSPSLRAALRVASEIYASDQYQRFSNVVEPRGTSALPVDLDPADREVVSRHAALRWLVAAQ